MNDALMDLLERCGITPADLYNVAPAVNPQPELFLLAEALLDFEENFLARRFIHVRMAERTIGVGTVGMLCLPSQVIYAYDLVAASLIVVDGA